MMTSMEEAKSIVVQRQALLFEEQMKLTLMFVHIQVEALSKRVEESMSQVMM